MNKQRPFRHQSIFVVSCICGHTIEVPDAERQAQCPHCNRLAVVVGWPKWPNAEQKAVCVPCEHRRCPGCQA